MVNLIGNLASWLCFQPLDACKLLECGRAGGELLDIHEIFFCKIKSPIEEEGIFSLKYCL